MIRPLLAFLLGLGCVVCAADPLPSLTLAPGAVLTVAEDGDDLVIPFTLVDALAVDGSDRIASVFATTLAAPTPTVSVVDVSRAAQATSGTLRLHPLPNANGPCNLVLNLVTVDGLVGGLLLTVDVLAVDDAPVLAVNVPLAVGTGGTAAYTAANLLLHDADGPSADQLRYTLTVPPAHGELRLNGTPLGAGQNFTQAEISAGSLSYRNLDGVADLWSFTWDDGAGKPARGPANATLVVAGKALPVVTLLGGGSWQEGYPAVLFAGSSLVEDGDSANFAGGSLSATIRNVQIAGDELSFLSDGPGDDRIEIAGSRVLYGGLEIGTWSGTGSLADPLVAAFTSPAATPAAAQALVRRLQFRNTTRNPYGPSRLVEVVVNDNDAGASPAGQMPVTVIPVNDAPTVEGWTLSTPMGFARRITLHGIDPELQSLSWSVVTPPGHGTLVLVNSDTWVVYLYTPTADFIGEDRFTVRVSDGLASSLGTMIIRVCGPDDRHLLPLADPPRELFPGDILSLNVPWDGGITAPMDFALDLAAPSGAQTLATGDSSAIVVWTVPENQPTGIHVRFHLLAGFRNNTGAGVLPFSILIRPRPGGGG
jgi:hypothetical protein